MIVDHHIFVSNPTTILTMVTINTEEGNKAAMKGSPVVRMSVEELNYPEDVAAFASFLPHPTTSTSMKSLRQNQGKKTATIAAAAAATMGTTSTDPVKDEFKSTIKDEKDTTKKTSTDGGIDKDKEKTNKSSSRGNNGNGGGSQRGNANNTSRSRVVGEPIPMAEGTT